MTGGRSLKSFILSRTLVDDEYSKPELAAEGFTWYIREAPAYGSQAVAFFKDIRTACYGMELLARYEWECQQDAWQDEDDESDAPPPVDFPIEHDLNWLRRLLVSEHEWELLPNV